MPLEKNTLAMAGTALNCSNSRRDLLPQRPTSPVLVSPLFTRLVLRATVVSDTAWEEQVITDSAFEPYGPHIEDLVIHAETRRRTGQFEWRLALQRKLFEGDWEPSSGNITGSDLVLAVQNADGYGISAVFADRARLGARIRLLLQWHTKSTGGGAIGDMAEVSAATALRRWS